jgi:hypothetical protein
MKSGRKPRLLALGTILLVLAASLGVISIAFFGGFIPGVEYGGMYTHSPTATYQGSFSVNYVGIYHYVQAVPVCRTVFPGCIASSEAVFYMNARNGTIRLIFYCGSMVKYYCDSPSQLPFSDGTCLHVKGTLLQPSKWPSDQFSPSIHFSGDLYVFQNQTLAETSCS